MIIWITGIPKSGKTTLAINLSERIGYCWIIDADDIRQGLNSDLSYSDEDRKENNRRLAELAKYIGREKRVIVTSLLPTWEIQDMARKIIPELKIIYLECTPQIARKRRGGDIYDRFKTLNYQIPKSPDLRLNAISNNELEVAEQAGNWIYKNIFNIKNEP